jgi:excisionase family DNA binding protein
MDGDSMPETTETKSLTITIAEAARISGMSEVTVRRWIADGVIPSKRVVHTRLIPRAELLRIIGVGEVVA